MEDYEVLGISKIEFTGKDGTLVKGMNVFVKYPLDVKKGGNGFGAERIFLSDARLSGIGLEVGDSIKLLYNKYGKIAEIKKVDLDFGSDID